MATDTDAKPQPSLERGEIQAAVHERLTKYEKLNFLEHFAMFMGMVQILEINLKVLLNSKYGVGHESMEGWTLGRTSHVLKERGLRGDFCVLLDSVVGYRNHVAHELMANEIMLRSLLGSDSARFEVRELYKGTYELEQLMLMYEWCDQHSAWD